jgi:flagellar motor switch protein FliN
MSPEATTDTPAAATEAGSPAAPAGMPLKDITAAAAEARSDPERNIELLRDVTLRVKVELGRGKMLLRDVLRLVEGSVVELEKLAGDPLDIYVNDRLVGKGEVLVLNENFCVRITQVFSPEECLRIKGIS